MLELLIFILLVYGLSFIITESEIFDNIREKIKGEFFIKLLNCLVCTSFWVGMIISFWFPITNIFIVDGIIALGAMKIISSIISF